MPIYSAESNEFYDDRGRYLIITHDMFYNTILPFAEWKHQKGFETEIRKISEVGSQDYQIRNFIVSAYQNWDVPPEYVLLVGDSEFLHTHESSDNYYADVEGDFREELYVGRFTADDISQCQKMVNKTMDYERTPFVSDSTWFTRACLVCNDNANDPQLYYDDTNYVEDLLLFGGYDDVNILSHGEGDDHDDVIDLVNEGVSFVNYRGNAWGETWLSPFDFIASQTNSGERLPIIISATCITGAVDWDGAFGEGWLRTGTPQNPEGAVAFYGTYTAHQAPNVTILRSAVDRAFFDDIFLNGEYILGKAKLYAKDAMLDMYPDHENVDVEYKGWILQGDPSLYMYTDVPQEMDVTHPVIIPVGAEEIDVACSVDDMPIENALVCFWKENSVYSWGYTDELGEITLSVDPIPDAEDETVHLTVTGKNLLVYETDVEIVDGEAFEGIVTDANSDEPLPGKVSLSSTQVYEFADDETGFYRLYVPSPGTYIVEAEYWGYESFESSPLTLAENDTMSLNIQLQPIEDVGHLEGYVLDYDNTPVSGAKLSVVNADRSPEFTDATGFYRFTSMLSDFEYLIRASCLYYDSYSQFVTVYEGEFNYLDFRLPSIENFEEGDGSFIGEDEWEWGIPEEAGGPEMAYDGEKVWGTDLDGLYENSTNQSLMTPEFYLGTSEDMYVMKVAVWYETLEGWDGGNVQVTTDGGESWQLLSPEEQYPDNSVVALGQAGFTGISDGWEMYHFDLANYAGSCIQIKFHFASTNSQGKGMFVDHFICYGSPPSVGAADISIAELPEKPMLINNYPNPFNPETTINFALSQKSNVALRVYDITGKLVKTLIEKETEAGYHSVSWDGTNESGKAVNSGLYLYRLDAGEYTDAHQMILLK